jgi:hypothetical protein
MLKIKNTDKIVGEPITNGWFIKSIHSVTTVQDLKVSHHNAYEIVIQNVFAKSEIKIYLDREYANIKLKGWYKLYTQRGKEKRVRLIPKDAVEDIRQLLLHIKILAIY